LEEKKNNRIDDEKKNNKIIDVLYKLS